MITVRMIDEDVDSIDVLETKFKAVDELYNAMMKDYDILKKKQEKPVNVHEKKELWNLNAVAIVAWKTSILRYQIPEINNLTGPVRFVQRFFQLLPLYMFRLLPLSIVFIEVVLLSSIVDQSFQRKKFIDHDGVYESLDIKYAQELPDHFFEIRATNVQKEPSCKAQCTTTVTNRMFFRDDLMLERPADEAQACIATSTGLYAAIQTNASYVVDGDAAISLFTHCLPWEYAHVCVHVLQQLPGGPAAAAAAAAAAAGSSSAAVLRQCGLPWNPAAPAGAGRVSLQDWRSIAVTPQEVPPADQIGSKHDHIIRTHITFRQLTLMRTPI